MTATEIKTSLQNGFSKVEDFLSYGLRTSEVYASPKGLCSPAELTSRVQAVFLDCVEHAIQNWQHGYLNKRTNWKGFTVHLERHATTVYRRSDGDYCEVSSPSVFRAIWTCEKIGNHVLVFSYERSDWEDLKVIGLRHSSLGGTENQAVVAFRHERALELVRQARKHNRQSGGRP